MFIAFEGGEGSGKSTQVALLARALELSHRVVVTREPGAGWLGSQVRGLVLDPAHTDLSPRAEALLYAADRAQHVATLVRPALNGGAVVLTDRYLDSSIAYQGAGRGLGSTDVAWISRWATAELLPHLTVVLDIDPRVGLARAGNSEFGARDRLEAQALAFHERVRAQFLALASAEPHRYLVADASASVLTTAALVLAAVRSVLERPTP